jgi:rubrerythrin
MEDLKFNKILDFAISKEKEAVQFYQALQNKAKFNIQKKVLKKFEEMEKGHIIILNNIKQKKEKHFNVIPKVEDLQISNYLVETKFTKSSSYQDIIIIAMKREEKAYKLYIDLANKTLDIDTKNLFRKLASEETKHKLHFEKIYEDEILSGN